MLPCPGAPSCSQMWPRSAPGFQEGSRVLMSISSNTQSIAVTWSCPCASVSLCWKIPGRLRKVSCQSKFGDRKPYASIKQPILQLWKGFLVVSKIYASKKITCCRNTTQGRNCYREDEVGIEAAGGQRGGSVYTGKCCSQHRQLPCSWYLPLGMDPTHCLVPQSRQEGKSSLTRWGR